MVALQHSVTSQLDWLGKRHLLHERLVEVHVDVSRNVKALRHQRLRVLCVALAYSSRLAETLRQLCFQVLLIVATEELSLVEGAVQATLHGLADELGSSHGLHTHVDRDAIFVAVD